MLNKVNSSKFKKAFIILGVLIVATFVVSMAVTLENHSKVEANTDLTYYLNVSYDGVDKNGVESTTTTTSEVRSGVIHVEDKIPDGLTFQGFVTTADGSIGAVKRGTTTACTGKVVDDTNEASTTEGQWNSTNTEYTYHGLHYDAATRTVTFNVKNLQAGCELVVGIITKTPATVDDPNTTEVETRRDFYNFGSANEGPLTFNSNTVHVYMGDDNATLYNVTYEYTGTVPSNAPAVPAVAEYAANNSVAVAANPVLEGYTFSGWTTTNATVNNGSFKMPASNVVLRGSFTEKDKKKVTYVIDGAKPSDYVVPSEKQYYVDSVVTVDSLQPGDIIGDYKFLGWESDDVTISEEGDFTMPNSNVTITGRFEEVKYKVIYKFYDGIKPPNADSLLPATREYKPGTTVTLATINNPTGYEFLGWYKENNFEMPNEDVTIYGEWKKVTGYFEPRITKEIVNEKSAYTPGEKITFKITVTNTASYPIKDVILKEYNDVTYLAGTGYTINSDHFVTINTIAANSSATVNAEYTVKDTDKKKITNKVEIKGALADNDYELKDKEYIATVDANINNSKEITITNSVKGNAADVNKDFTYTISLKDDEDVTDTTTSLKIIKADGTESTIKNGGTFTLKHGEQAVISVPVDYTFTVTESIEGSYITTVDKTSTDNRTVSVKIAANDTINYTNELNESPLTGLNNNIVAYLILTALAFISIIGLVIIKKDSNKNKIETLDL